jgi:hypothetical protein
MILLDFNANLVIFSHLSNFIEKKSRKTMSVAIHGIIGLINPYVQDLSYPTI